MFEVCFVSASGVDERHVVKQWWMARAIAKRAVQEQSKKVVVRRIRTDIWIADSRDGTLHRVRSGMPAERAAKWAREWAGVNREHGCLLWPCGVKLPKALLTDG